jgi:hypothetical protein
MIKKQFPDNEREKQFARLCHSLAPANPARAEALARSLRDPLYQAQAWQWMAEQRASLDRTATRRYWENAHRILLAYRENDPTNIFKNSHRRYIWLNMALLAREMKWRDAREPLLRALADLPTGESEYATISEGSENLRQQGAFALGLSLIDPAMGRDYLQLLMPALRRALKKDKDYELRDAFRAMIACDPALFETLVREAPAKTRPQLILAAAGWVFYSHDMRHENLRRAFWQGEPNEED